MTIVDIAQTWGVGKRMQVARQEAGLEQRDMAARLGVTRQTVSNWERGNAEPSFSVVVRWAKESGQSLEWLAAGVWVRHEGFEPPTFWSVVSAPAMLAVALLAMMREAAQR